MKFTKRLHLLNFKVILSLIFLNTSISFAQNINKWNEGTYLGVSLIFNTIREGSANYINDGFGDAYNYNGDREISKGLKIGYNKMITDSIFVGPEFSYSAEKNLDFNDSENGGITDNIRFKENYNLGLRAGYAVSKDIAYVVGVGKSYQKIETSFINDFGVDDNIKNANLQGVYKNFGILFNLGSDYNLELLYQINNINSNIHNNEYGIDGEPNHRNPHTISIDKVKSTSITISKFF